MAKSDAAALRNELAQLRQVLGQVGQVYEQLTGGQIRDPQAAADQVIAAAEALKSAAVNEALADARAAGEIPAEAPAPLAGENVAILTLGLPIATDPGPMGYASHSIDVHLDGHEAKALKRLTEGLARSGVTLRDGAAIQHHRSAVRWLLQQIPAEMP